MPSQEMDVIEQSFRHIEMSLRRGKFEHRELKFIAQLSGIINKTTQAKLDKLCGECGAVAQHIRITPHGGTHRFCNVCAKTQPDFTHTPEQGATWGNL
jgi:hypothetical protein